MRKYIDIIRNKINGFQNDYVFISKDFISDVDYETVRKTLSRLCEKSEIKKYQEDIIINQFISQLSMIIQNLILILMLKQ